MNAFAHVVIVDDDSAVRDTVAEYFRRNGFSVSEAEDAPGLRAIMAQRAIDLALLDIGLRGEDGIGLASEIRKAGSAGIIMLTGRADDVDKIVCLEVGADDYVTKPFNPRELLARAKAVLRRAHADNGVTATLGQEVQIGKCRINLESRRLYDEGGEEISLTAMEFDLLRVFVENPDRVLSRDRLLDMAHGKDIEPFDRSIDTRIARIRKKVELDPAKPDSIKTVRSAGYVFNPHRA